MRHGFAYTTLPGQLTNIFTSMEDARAVASRFYGSAAMGDLDATNRPELPFHVLGVKPPNDLCWPTVSK
jgi:hypothetical protein